MMVATPEDSQLSVSRNKPSTSGASAHFAV